ncbi:MAG: hypothetical protein HYU66_02080 [Armatimonadetes bacterium]|nr:hypothetical protein [Armatimonadota bacterium]
MALIGATCAALWLAAADLGELKPKLESPFHKGLYGRTYRSLLERVEPDGYFEESLTGAYQGMFPRTVGGLVSLFLLTGELDRSEQLLGFVLRATQDNGMERIPHVVGRTSVSDEPQLGPGDIGFTRHTTALYRLDQPERFGGAQEFSAPPAPLRAAEIWLTADKCAGPLRLELAETLTGPSLAHSEVETARIPPGGGWVRFVFHPPPLVAGRQYVLRASHHGTGVPAWWGVDTATERPFGGGHGRDTQIQADWFANPGHVAAFALGTGGLRHEVRRTTPVYSARDEIDGQAHILMAFARLALRRGPTQFEAAWYPSVAKLMDRTSDWPYLAPFHRQPIGLADVGLVRNVSLEHSRDGRFWDTYDILTQSFVAAALTDMARLAERRGDQAATERWRVRLNSLQQAVRERLTRELDGGTCYLEMRLPDGGAGTPFPGLGWLNLAPVAAQWEGADETVLRNTVAAYRRRAMFDAAGVKALATDWWPARALEATVIGKGVGWELVYCLREHEWARIGELLDLVAAMNRGPIYMEAASWRDGTWYAGDPGNGEQCAWWCWGMAKVRAAAGMSPTSAVPARQAP